MTTDAERDVLIAARSLARRWRKKRQAGISGAVERLCDAVETLIAEDRRRMVDSLRGAPQDTGAAQ